MTLHRKGYTAIAEDGDACPCCGSEQPKPDCPCCSGGVWNAVFNVGHDGQPSGNFTVEVHPDWAPKGAARFKELVNNSFFKYVRFFRVVSGFMAQFGINGNPEVQSKWKN